jgi:hypothetical protein
VSSHVYFKLQIEEGKQRESADENFGEQKKIVPLPSGLRPTHVTSKTLKIFIFI